MTPASTDRATTSRGGLEDAMVVALMERREPRWHVRRALGIFFASRPTR